MTKDQAKIKQAMEQLREAYILLNELMPTETKQEQFKPVGEDYASQRIGKIVKEVFGADPFIRTRKRSEVSARHAFRYLLRKHTLRSLESIAFLTGSTDHTTVRNSVQTASDLIETDTIFADLILKCEAKI